MIVYWNLLFLFPNLIKLFQQALRYFIKQTNAYKVNSFICDSVSIGISLPIKDQFSYHIESSQLTYSVNQWTGLSIIRKLIVNKLIENIPLHEVNS